ncbi:hypothetical protein DPD22_15815 [Salmonella enterica subsp. enterica]|nr:hypothetical protein [Salmonella enterica subsp. enterica serovar Stanley]
MTTLAKEEHALREEMVRIAASFFQRGYATGSAGNLSLLLPDGNILATPTGSCLGNLDPQRLSKVDPQGEWLSGDKPSKEVRFHLALYRNNPCCKAVVHLHSTWSTALSCLEGLDPQNVIRPFTPYVVMRIAGIFNVDIGAMLLTGMALAVPCVIGIVFYAQWLDKRYPDFVPRTLNADEVNAALEQYNKEKEQKDLPSLTLSLLPIVVPIVLIFLKAICSTLATVEGWSGLATHPVVQAINFVGSPVIALAISVLLAVYTLVPRMDKHTTAERLEEGLQSAGIILLVTGAGGALGAILRDSGAGQQLAEQVANLPISPILIPFIVATLVRLIQGSGTVAMITAASISAPILAQIPGINMLLVAQAATMGSLFFGYFNDSLFWVVNRMMGVSDVKQQMVVWSVPTTIAWAIGGTGVALINLLFGSGGSWLDPLLPIVVLAAIMLWVRWQAQGIKDKLVVKD